MGHYQQFTHKNNSSPWRYIHLSLVRCVYFLNNMEYLDLVVQELRKKPVENQQLLSAIIFSFWNCTKLLFVHW